MGAVTFDVWHTLMFLSADDAEGYRQARRATVVTALRAAPATDGSATPTDESIAAAFEQALAEAIAASDEGRTVTPREQFARTGRAVGRRGDGEAYAARLDTVVEGLPFVAVPAAVDAVARLRQEGHRVAVVGNTVGEHGAALRRVLDRLGFGGLFDAYAFSDEHPWAKPAPELFWWALRSLGESPRRAVHVGDAWFDVEGARRAGFRGSVWFTGVANTLAPDPRTPALSDPRGVARRAETMPGVVAAARELLGPA